MDAQALRSELTNAPGSALNWIPKSSAAPMSRATDTHPRPSYAMSRYVSECAHDESPWTAASHMPTKSVLTRNRQKRTLENLESALEMFHKREQPDTSHDGEPLSFVLNKSGEGNNRIPDHSLHGRTHANQDLDASSNIPRSAYASIAGKASRPVGQGPLAMHENAPAIKQHGTIPMRPKPSGVAYSRNTLSSFIGRPTEGPSTDTKADKSSSPSHLPPHSSSRATTVDTAPHETEVENLRTVLRSGQDSGQLSSPSVHRTQAPLLARAAKSTSHPDSEDLKSHANAFIALLAAYGIRARGNDNSGSSKNPSSSREGRQGNLSGSQSFNTPSNDRRAISKRDTGSDPEDEPPPPEKRQKRPQRQDSSGRRWACPYAKLDGVTYHHCVGWSCERIESVKRHLRSKHAMSATVEQKVKKSPPFKTPEDRWRAYYSKLFGIAREDIHLIPSPYFEDIPLNAKTTAAPECDSPLPAEWWTTITHSEVQIEEPINPHAPIYASEARQLAERHEVRLGDLRLRAEQAQAQLQAIEEERMKIKAELEREFERMFTRFRQNLPLEVQQMDPVQPFLSTQHLADSSWSVTQPFEIPEFEERTPRPTLESMGLQPEQASLQDDSGYGTLSDDTFCTCHEGSCYKCEVSDLLYVLEGELPQSQS